MLPTRNPGIFWAVAKLQLFMPVECAMGPSLQNHQFEGAKRVRAELRLALAQADELMRRAKSVLSRNRPSGRKDTLGIE